MHTNKKIGAKIAYIESKWSVFSAIQFPER